MRQADYVRALLREREGYVLKGRSDRVADVDKELARNGANPEKLDKAAPSAPETTTAAPPPERATPPRPGRNRA